MGGDKRLQEAVIPPERALAAASGAPDRAPESAQSLRREDGTGAAAVAPQGMKGIISQADFDKRVAAALQTLHKDGGPSRFFEDVLQLTEADEDLRRNLSNHITDSLRKAQWHPLTTAATLSNLVGQTLSKDGGLCMNMTTSSLKIIFRGKPRGTYDRNKAKRDLADNELGIARVDGGALNLMKLLGDGRYWINAEGTQESLASVMPDWIVNVANLRK
jgi:hypothetical protein